VPDASEEVDDRDESPRPRRRRLRRNAQTGSYVLYLVLGGAGLAVVSVLVCGGIPGLVYLRARAHHRHLGGPVVVHETPERVFSADQLIQDYERDPAASDKKYQNQAIEVTGTVERVTRDPTKTWYVILRVGGGGPRATHFQCFFDGADEDDVADLKDLNVGEEITVRGRFEGKQEVIRLRDCEFTD
jgi:hypothetical protein